MSYQPNKGIVISSNSSTAALASLATYTGTWYDVSSYPSVTLAVITDQAGTAYIEFSSDGTNADSSIQVSVTASLNEVHVYKVTRKYFRARFTNTSASSQTYFRLQTLAGQQGQLTSGIGSVVQSDADSSIVRPLDFNLMVAESLYQNRGNTIKDGVNFDIDTASVPEDIINHGGVYSGFPASPIASEIVVAGADTGTVYYSYMATETDLDYTFASKAVTGAGTYALGHNIWRCNFSYFVANTSTAFNVGAITIQSVGAANVFVLIDIGYSQSYCAAYTVPYNSSIYIDRISGSVRGSASGSLDGFFWYRPYGESPRLRFPFELQFGGIYFDDIDYLTKVPARTDIVPRIITASTNNLQGKINYRFVKVKE